MCSDDPFNDGVSDLVVDLLVVGTADEELVLIGEKGHERSQSRTETIKLRVQSITWFADIIGRYWLITDNL